MMVSAAQDPRGMRFEEQTALVTGGTRGIGHAIAAGASRLQSMGFAGETVFDQRRRRIISW